MKVKTIFWGLLILFICKESVCQQNNIQITTGSYYTEALKDTLVKLSQTTDNAFFKLHCNSMLSVINSKSSFTERESAFLEQTYHAFNKQNTTSSPKELSTYLKRSRPFILSWVSPTDGSVSFSWLSLPKDWDPTKKYPLYIQLHGFWSVADNAIEYLTYPFLEPVSDSYSFEDGYLLSPWGRGNLWYQGISETDIWECIAALEDIAVIDPARKYLSGHSMGGYGAWSIASKSPDTWAAIGIHAGALWFSNAVNTTAVNALKNMPTYFVCGINDDLLTINQTAYRLLRDVENTQIHFDYFYGGHEYLEANVTTMYFWMRNYVKKVMSTDLIKPAQTELLGSLIHCLPNPANSNSTIIYTGTVNTTVHISIYDSFGRLIEEVTDKVRNNGENRVTYDTSELRSGIYLIRMKSDKGVSDTKMIIVH